MYLFFELRISSKLITSRFQIIATSEDQEYWTPYNIRSPLFCPNGHRAVDSAFPLINNLTQVATNKFCTFQKGFLSLSSPRRGGMSIETVYLSDRTP